MPPATGFQYTPPSYLLRAGDTTNRPWSKTSDGNDGGNGDDDGHNEYDLPQEDRPPTKRESHLDAHFRQRVRNKQSRYRNILQGGDEVTKESPEFLAAPSTTTTADGGGDDDDSVLAAAANADSYATLQTARLDARAALSHEQARKNRKERIAGLPESPPGSSKTNSDAENARNLRAHRLRSSLLKQSPDDSELQTKLEMRRMARRDEEAAARRAQREASRDSDPTIAEDTIRRTRDLEEQRIAKEKAAEAEREAQAVAKLLRAARLNEERIRQRELETRLEEHRVSSGSSFSTRQRRPGKENDARSKTKRAAATASTKTSTIKTRRYASGNASKNSDGDTFMTEFDAENDFAFLNDLTGMVRDSGILKTCAGCFGETTDDDKIVDAGVVGGSSFATTNNSIECSSNSNNNNNNNKKAGNNNHHNNGSSLGNGFSSHCGYNAWGAALSSVFVPDLVPSSDNSASDDGRGDRSIPSDESIRRSREYARYRE